MKTLEIVLPVIIGFLTSILVMCFQLVAVVVVIIASVIFIPIVIRTLIIQHRFKKEFRRLKIASK